MFTASFPMVSSPMISDLPIEGALPALIEALRAGTGAVLQAPPGAGKTTRVPLALLDEPWLAGGRIIMLEPRRLAARAAARRMAATLGERVGATVGYRMRLETQVGPRTRIEVVTEGVLARFLQTDPALDGIGLVIFDEFHERSLQADLGLALFEPPYASPPLVVQMLYHAEFARRPAVGWLLDRIRETAAGLEP